LGINDIHFLGDYIDKRFFDIDVNRAKREDLVAYNPSKGKKFTESLIKASPGSIRYEPIINMSRNDVIRLLLRSKIYVDFGFHPGRDRIPREAAVLGCCVIASMRGSAAFVEDLPIASGYKFVDNKKNIRAISGLIQDCLSNYSGRTNDFASYRQVIASQESEFENDVLRIFGRP